MDNLFVTFIIAYNLTILAYFLFLNSFYLVLLVLAAQKLWYHKRKIQTERLHGNFLPFIVKLDEEKKSKSLPSLAFIMPSYNEENTILESVNAISKIDYPYIEIIVVNDGSNDNTLELLRITYNLFKDSRALNEKLQTKKVINVFKSAIDERLLVIDKENGGKADALNAGLNYARSRLFLAVDADSIVDPEAIDKMIQAYLERDSKVVGIGGIVRVANGSRIESGKVLEARMPKEIFPGFQIVEYIRAFLCGRAGFSKLKNLLIISGAFGLFEVKTVVNIGGYKTNILGEDMELVVRLHKHMRKIKKEYDVVFVPEPVCWTQVPEKYSTLEIQRIRWHQGLIQTLRIHWKMIFNPKYGTVGTIGMPYFFIFEFLGPIIEITGYIAFIGGYLLGLLNITFAILFFLLAMVFGVLISLFSLLIEEFTVRRYNRPLDVFKLFILAVLENFGYRQLTAWWRVKATLLLLFRRKKWGQLEKGTFESNEEDLKKYK
ncbi:MAG TPA: glycosyltransferase [Methanofastidiosum sp.]|nr:glycosyltransferase [Methanofastidiosum sp.]HNU60840.1 glycosyltransferase [Methanofastidiosum sp.]